MALMTASKKMATEAALVFRCRWQWIRGRRRRKNDVVEDDERSEVEVDGGWGWGWNGKDGTDHVMGMQRY